MCNWVPQLLPCSCVSSWPLHNSIISAVMGLGKASCQVGNCRNPPTNTARGPLQKRPVASPYHLKQPKCGSKQLNTLNTVCGRSDEGKPFLSPKTAGKLSSLWYVVIKQCQSVQVHVGLLRDKAWCNSVTPWHLYAATRQPFGICKTTQSIYCLWATWKPQCHRHLHKAAHGRAKIKVIWHNRSMIIDIPSTSTAYHTHTLPQSYQLCVEESGNASNLPTYFDKQATGFNRTAIGLGPTTPDQLKRIHYIWFGHE